MRSSSVIAVACLVAACASTQAFVLPSTSPSSTTTTSARQQPRALSSSTALAASSSSSMHDRRGLLFKTTGSLLGLAGLALVRPANAYDEVPLVRDKLGGLLEPYTDIAKGLKVSRPSGWNQFEGSPETYVVKWSDIINRDELVILNSTPVKASTTAVDALGDVQEVGKKLAKGRGAELVEAKARLTEGVLFYDFEFKGEAISEVASLCVAKGRLWNLSATAGTKRWAKKRDLLKGVIGSFLPKL